MPGSQVEVCNTLAALEALAPAWEHLGTVAAPNVFLTYAWYRAWSAELAREIPAIRPHVLALRRGDGSVAAIAPLIEWRHTRLGVPLRKIEFAGIHADYNGFLLGSNPTENANGIFAHLARTASAWDILDLHELPSESATVLRSAAESNGLHCQQSSEPESCPYLSLTDGVTDPLQRLGGDARRELRRRINRAAAQGCRVRIVEQPQNEPGLLDRLITLDAAKNQHKSSPVFLGRYPQVFAALFRELGPRGWLYVALLEQEGRAISFQLGFRCGRKLWDYTKAFDRSFAHLAPGTLLLPPLLEYAHANGYEEYDFLRGDEPYKLSWSTGQRTRYRLLIWNRTWRSREMKWLFRDLKRMLAR